MARGINFFRVFNYIQAFYSFYFILEDFYAEGKSDEKEVVKRFDRSREFSNAASFVFVSATKESRHQVNLQKLFKEENLDFGLGSLSKFLFRIRGRTHHFSSKNSRTQATPYTQKDFESVAYLTMGIAAYVLASRVDEEAKLTGKAPILSQPSSK